MRKKSLYRENWIFVTLNQQQALSQTDDLDLRFQCEEENRSCNGVLSKNPLDMDDFFFAGVERMIGKIHCLKQQLIVYKSFGVTKKLTICYMYVMYYYD